MSAPETPATPGQALNDILIGRTWTIGRWETLAPADRAEMEAMASEIRAAIAARQPQPAPTRAELETAMAAAIQDLIDEDEVRQPQPAPGGVLAKVRAIVFRSDTQQARIRDLVALLDPALDDPEPQPAPEPAAAMADPDDGCLTPIDVLEQERDQLQEQLGRLQDSIGNLAAGLKLSAGASRPSKKSEIEDGVAAALLGILDPR